MKVGIIGGGAAGFFSSITVKEKYPDADVTIMEKTSRVLSKVRISGGGRCNVTNACDSVDELCKAYPRGGRKLKKIFHVFSNKDAMAWFEAHGVPLTVQEDGCVFPTSQNSQSIIDCLVDEAERLRINTRTDCGVRAIIPIDEKLKLAFDKKQHPTEIFDKVIFTTGGSPERSGLKWLEDLGHKIEDPAPSLFTFNMPDEPITRLMGVVVENVLVSIQGTKIKASGPLLVTHWGMSGPAVIILSSYGARIMKEMNYHFRVQVNWVNEINNDAVMEDLTKIMTLYSGKILSNFRPYSLPSRLWDYLLEKCDISSNKTWGELGKKGLNKVMNILTNDVYCVKGRTTFRDEFVTCGGVSLNSIDLNTMQSRVCKNLYFAGEVLDIDAITGGYNFQCAWTTGFIAGKLG